MRSRLISCSRCCAAFHRACSRRGRPTAELWRDGRVRCERMAANTAIWPSRTLDIERARSGSKYSTPRAAAVVDTVDASIEGEFSKTSSAEVLATSLKNDAVHLLRHLRAQRTLSDGPVELSLLLCDDAHMAELNAEYRGKRGPTDILSFEAESPPGYPLRLLGDLVISLDTAQRQAEERRHSLECELRVLLVHGALHLLGHDHELGAEDAQVMAAEESHILASLGWQGSGLIASAGERQAVPAEAEQDVHGGERLDAAASASGAATQPRRQASRGRRDVRLLALDMDGTLLDSRSRVLPSSVDALRAALAAGVRVCLATGKARPAAMAAMARVGLAGEGLVISSKGPGLFLQGLAVHGGDGSLIEGPSLPPQVVSSAFTYAQERQVPLAAFLGDECVTLQMHPELEELHHRYYEPLCQPLAGIDAMLAGPPVKKLLFMTSADAIARQHQPHWQAALRGCGAETTMAVPNMLEIVPAGANKWVGMRLLLAGLGLSPAQLMACGDGANDLQLVENSGWGIAMGNAVPQVKEAAKVVVASNDDGGIAEAIERFILD